MLPLEFYKICESINILYFNWSKCKSTINILYFHWSKCKSTLDILDQNLHKLVNQRTPGVLTDTSISKLTLRVSNMYHRQTDGQTDRPTDSTCVNVICVYITKVVLALGS